MKQFNCARCGTIIEAEPLVLFGREMFSKRYCDACIVLNNQEQAERQAADAKIAREKEWLDICPPLYRLTDPHHPDIPKATLAKIMAWIPKADGVGLGVFGKTGRCKTRMVYLLCRELHMSGVKLFAIGSKSLGNCFSRSFGDGQEAGLARDAITKARAAKVLFLDDLGKEKFTEHVESEFYDLVEHRTSHLKPTLWTANATGSELEAMMSQDRGAAIVRRLREFSEPITTD